MTVVVGHDSAKTRRTLTVGDAKISYYSIAAAQTAGLGDFSRLPAALKVCWKICFGSKMVKLFQSTT